MPTALPAREITTQQRCRWFLLLPLVLISLVFVQTGASGADARILPGQRLGRVALGQSVKEIHRALGRPDTSARLADGTLREDWLSKRLAPQAYVYQGLYYRHDFLTVYFRRGRAVQAEASSPLFKTADGLTRASDGLRFRKRYPGFKTIAPPHFHNLDPGGCPATKHFVVYEDALAAGIAWRYGGWGNLAPDVNIRDVDALEIVIVHRRNYPVMIDPDGGIRLVWTLPPSQLMEHYPAK